MNYIYSWEMQKSRVISDENNISRGWRKIDVYNPRDDEHREVSRSLTRFCTAVARELGDKKRNKEGSIYKDRVVTIEYLTPAHNDNSATTVQLADKNITVLLASGGHCSIFRAGSWIEHVLSLKDAVLAAICQRQFEIENPSTQPSQDEIQRYSKLTE